MTKKLSLAILTAAFCVAAPFAHAKTIMVGKHTNTTTGDGHKHHKGGHKDKGPKDDIPAPPPQN